MCRARGCDKPGTARPVLELRPRRDRPGPRLRFPAEISVCEEHRASATVETFLSDEGFDKVCRHLREAGKQAPPRKHVALLWESAGPELLGARVELVEPGAACPGDEDLAF